MVATRSQGCVRSFVQINPKTKDDWARCPGIHRSTACGPDDPASLPSCRLRLYIGPAKWTSHRNSRPVRCKPVVADLRDSTWDVSLAANRYDRYRGDGTCEWRIAGHFLHASGRNDSTGGIEFAFEAFAKPGEKCHQPGFREVSTGTAKERRNLR